MWTEKNIPDQSGRTAIVTGANTGLGFEISRALYQKGAHVILACRNLESATKAMAKIKECPGRGSLEIAHLDLSSLDAVRKFAESIIGSYQVIDLLINNGGVMVPPASKTADGFELQFGVNFLGHFALIQHLYPLMKNTLGSRVVSIGSGAYKMATLIDFDNLRSEKSYDPYREYAISKLADLQFMLELQRRFKADGAVTLSLAAHPGVTQTTLSRHMSAVDYQNALAQFKELMPAWQGALPALFAATDPNIIGGQYFGPDGKDELTGFPAIAELNSYAIDEIEAAKLWTFAETALELSGTIRSV